MATQTGTIPITMLEATTNLTENLLRSEPFLRLRAAEEKFRTDSSAAQLLKDFSELQEKVRHEQFSGAISEGDLIRLRELQSAVIDNEAIQNYELSHKLAVAFLQEINQEISQLLGIDFASLTRRAGGCC